MKNLPLFFACLLLPIQYREDTPKCNASIALWLLVMAGIHLAFCIKAVFTLSYILKQPRAKKLKKIANIVTLLTLNAFEIGWQVYGNTFHFGTESIKCKNQSKGIQSLWILMMIELALGYLVYVACGILLGTVSIYLWY
jgi:hypothetical protein